MGEGKPNEQILLEKKRSSNHPGSFLRMKRNNLLYYYETAFSL